VFVGSEVVRKTGFVPYKLKYYRGSVLLESTTQTTNALSLSLYIYIYIFIFICPVQVYNTNN